MFLEFAEFKKDKKFLITVSVITALIFVLAMLQNVIRYGMHDSYDPWYSLLYLAISVLLFLPLVQLVIFLARKLINHSMKSYWVNGSVLVIAVIVLYFLLASIIFYTIGNSTDWILANFASYYFGREVVYHFLLASGTLYYVYYKFGKDSEKMISGTIGRKQVTLKANQIEFIEADDHYLKLHAKDGSLIKRATMENMTEALKPDFIRIHRKYLVNKSAIKAKEKYQRDEYVILNSGNRLKISRSYQPLDF